MVCIGDQNEGVDFQELTNEFGANTGELGVLKNQPRAAIVVAETQVEVLRIDRDIFIRWHEKIPKEQTFFVRCLRFILFQRAEIKLVPGGYRRKETMTSVIGGPTTGVVLRGY